VLAALERAVLGLEVDVLATALLARVEQSDEQREARMRGFTWSNAGHLPPLLRLPDGTTRLLESEPDLLLGLTASATRHDSSVEVPDGATIVLCTDGLVERRGEDLDVGLERLRVAVQDLGHLAIEELCDALTTRLRSDEAEDDVALLAIRFGAQDD
jgi:serine phosphatase RsbU (regulator of sigma subunit)